MKRSFRNLGIIFIVLGTFFRFNADPILLGIILTPGGSNYLAHLRAVEELSTLVVASGSLMLILSFTTLVEDQN
jgi:hypothetical protein